MSNFIEKIMDQNEVVIHLVTATNTDHQPFYAYVMMRADRWRAIESRMEDMNVDFAKEGTILASGHGHEPDAATKAAIELIIQKLEAEEKKA
ncbi:MAG: hypothetical protein K2Q01_00195 [Rickettsiales bacterium]|nr:hypothetical protein [Rickettsiales bacterium]